MIQRQTGKLSDVPAVFWIFAFGHFQRHCLNELLLATKNSDSNSISTRIKGAYLSVYSILPNYMALLKRISLACTLLPLCFVMAPEISGVPVATVLIW